jgi:hypothetical protein
VKGALETALKTILTQSSEPLLLRSVLLWTTENSRYFKIHQRYHLIDSLSDVCLDILAQSGPYVKLTPNSASHFFEITKSNNTLLQLKLLKSFLVLQSPTKAVGKESKTEFTVKDRLFYNREALKALEKARSGLPSDTVRQEANLLADNLKNLEFQSDCIGVVTFYLYFKLLNGLGRRNLPKCFESLEKFQLCSEFEIREFLVEAPALKKDAATEAFLADWQLVCFVPLDFASLTERIVVPFFLYELNVLKELKSTADDKRFRAATDLILLSLTELFDGALKQNNSASYLSTADSMQFPISVILFLENVLTYAGPLASKLLWEEIIFKIEILCEDDLLRNKQEFEAKGIVYDRLFNKFNVQYEYFWLPELLMRRNSLPKQEIINQYIRTSKRIMSERSFTERNRAFYIVRMINNLTLLANVLQREFTSQRCFMNDAGTKHSIISSLNTSALTANQKQMTNTDKLNFFKDGFEILRAELKQLAIDLTARSALIEKAAFVEFYLKKVDDFSNELSSLDFPSTKRSFTK